ncbi:GNAT family N-acetyltransferase [Pseudomonas zhanjiangensis]|uniref:N-acetyltransferase family protein n=1 Tax=Pseudomonas zhanjiangensis TaxID=3239015 RepID=A0ABV3YTS9_9PSED
MLELMRALAEFEDYLQDFTVDRSALLQRAFGPAPQCQVFVAVADTSLRGYAVVLEVPFTYDLRPTLLLKELYIEQGWRGRGLGQRLMQAVARWGAGRGAGRLKWDVLAGNQAAETFYRHLGGRPDDKWIGYQMDSAALVRLAEGCI